MVTYLKPCSLLCVLLLETKSKINRSREHASFRRRTNPAANATQLCNLQTQTQPDGGCVIMVLNLIFAALLLLVVAEATTSPNIILLLTDDQDSLLGGIDRMPKLRQHLIDQGTTFTNAYVHTPICCPSRSSILSGRYLHNGVTKNNSVSGNCNGKLWQDDAERKTFAVYAQEAGYVTSYAGKYLNTYGCQDEEDTECKRVPPGWNKWHG